jgi:hypothetical protein
MSRNKAPPKQAKALSRKNSRVTFALMPVNEDAELYHGQSPEFSGGNSPSFKISKSMPSSASSNSFQLEEVSVLSSGDSDLLSVSQAEDFDENSEIDLDQFFA